MRSSYDVMICVCVCVCVCVRVWIVSVLGNGIRRVSVECITHVPGSEQTVEGVSMRMTRIK